MAPKQLGARMLAQLARRCGRGVTAQEAGIFFMAAQNVLTGIDEEEIEGCYVFWVSAGQPGQVAFEHAWDQAAMGLANELEPILNAALAGISGSKGKSKGQDGNGAGKGQDGKGTGKGNGDGKGGVTEAAASSSSTGQSVNTVNEEGVAIDKPDVKRKRDNKSDSKGEK